MTWRLRPRPHRHDRVECWCELTPAGAPALSNRGSDEAGNVLAGFCEHGVGMGMLDRCDTCRPPAVARWTTEWVHPGADYRNRLPAMLRDTLTDSRGAPCFTTTDRRWLWHLEGFLAVSATNATQRQLQTDLQIYLRETCEHHWNDYRAEQGIAAHRQCLWCSDVEWKDEM